MITRSQSCPPERQPVQGRGFVFGGAHDLDRRHLFERRDQVLPDDRAVFDDKGFEGGHFEAGVGAGYYGVDGLFDRRTAAKAPTAREIPSDRRSIVSQIAGRIKSVTTRCRVGHVLHAECPDCATALPNRGMTHRLLRAAALCVGFLFAAAAVAAPAIVVGSKRFTESLRAGRDRAPDAGSAAGVAGRAPPGPGQHRHPRAGAGQRRGRRLPRIHRHHRARAAQAREATRRWPS